MNILLYFNKKIVFLFFTLLFLSLSGAVYAVPANCISTPNQEKLQPNERPLSDWLLNQALSVRGTINGITFHRYPFSANRDLSIAYDVDFSGVRACDLGLPPPIIEGKVTERALADGTAQVTVSLHVSKAIVYVVKSSVISTNPSLCTAGSITSAALCPTLFGYSLKDMALDHNLQPTLGDAYVQVQFINTAPGAPLPDLQALLASSDLYFLSINSSAEGGLRAAYGVPDGTPGRAQDLQIGEFTPGLIDNTDSHVPGLVKLQVTGK